jgi:dihydropteroate synthase
MAYYRPITSYGSHRRAGALTLAGGNAWFDKAEVLSRDTSPQIIDAQELPPQIRDNLCEPRPEFANLDMARAHVMGVLNTTPDSFSDGGLHEDADIAIARGREMLAQGAAIIDVGGESTRPGADFVDRIAEINRVQPVISALSSEALISIDTRKADVARAAMDAGAQIFNDVTALSFDPRSLSVLEQTGASVCLMHASGDPKTMQDDPRYDNVLLEVYDYLATRVQLCLDAGIPKSKISIDPGIGFGKTTAHNLLLIRGLSLFHGLGCPILLGVSRKRFIGELGDAQLAADRVGGSIAVALEGLRQGVQLLRVHDVKETVQAVKLFEAMG